MKLYGIFGKGSGKLGSSVFAISGGEQIMREYNPIVANPNTPAQVEQRAKFKLLSQLAASMAKAIAFKKQGLVSARNQFVSANYPLVEYENNAASVTLTAITLTGSQYPIQPVSVERAASGGGFVFDLGDISDDTVNKVVIVAFNRYDENMLGFHDSIIYERGTEGWTPSRDMIPTTDPLVFYVYGIRETSSALNIKFNDYVVDTDQRDAVLNYASTLISSGALLTQTIGKLIA